MFETKDFAETIRKALLISAYDRPSQKAEAESLLGELDELVWTLGVPVYDRMLLHIRERQPKFLIGSGKAEQIAELVKEKQLDVVIFDNELSPSQQRNWEKLAGVPVIDRTEVILDIFARRAHTREARLQIDLARLEHALPRLTGAWSHLIRQGGGIGGRGEGETQLEQDKRRIRTKIDKLKEELEEVRSARATQRKDRKRAPVPNAAIVGYTNSGKSSLLRRLTGAEVLVEDKLFATLDTTTRKIDLPNKQPLLLTDTVGFVRKLPHQLVESFNATLEEAAFSDFLIHLLDASQPEVMEFYHTTMKVLAELQADERPMIVALNKVDAVQDRAVLAGLRQHFPDAHFISVHTGEGLPELIEHMGEFVSNNPEEHELQFPHAAGEALARLHRETRVLETRHNDEGTRVRAMLPEKLAERYAAYMVAASGKKPAGRRHSLQTNRR
jgi:GTP-binding protein HflX